METPENKRMLRLIGLVGRTLIRERLKTCREADTYGLRLRFDSLEPEFLASCLNEITADDACYGDALGNEGIQILLPAGLVDPSLIKDGRISYPGNAAAARNERTDKRILLFANGASAQIEDTLKEVVSINTDKLLERPEPWITGLCVIYPQLSTDAGLQSKLVALASGFRKSLKRGLRMTALYLLRVAEGLAAGSVIEDAASDALPELRLPHFKSAMPRRQLEKAASWEKAFSIVKKKIPAEIFCRNERPVSLDLATLAANLYLIKEEGEASQKAIEVYESLSKNDGVHQWDDLLELNWLADSLERFVSPPEAPPSRKSLGMETRDFFEANCYSEMEKEIRGTGLTFKEFLDDFAENDKKKNDPEFKKTAQLFYNDAEKHLSQKLLSKWEKLLFSTPIEGSDFIDCLVRAACKLARMQKGKVQDPVLLVCLQTPTKNFFTDVNCRVLHFFSAMYRGLETECGGFVKFCFKNLDFEKTKGLNPLFHLEEARNELQKYRGSLYGKSVKKDSLQLKFFVYLIGRGESSAGASLKQKTGVRITWSLPKNSAAMGLDEDLGAVRPKKNGQAGMKNALSVIIGKNFRQTNSRGLLSEISLKDMSTFGLNKLCLVSSNASNLNRDLRASFNVLLDAQKVSPAGIDTSDIRAKWDSFLDLYRKALEDFSGIGLGAASIAGMRDSYSDLLKSVSDAAGRSDEFGRPALSILLSIGVFSFVDDSTAYAVATPWNPLRLFDLHRSFVAKTALIKAILEKPDTAPGDEDAFVQRLADHAKAFEPSLVAVPKKGLLDDKEDAEFRCDELLSPVEQVAGYTLYSRVAGKNCRGLGTDPASVSEFTDVAANNYLKLMPEATNCLRLLLPDAASKEFPLRIAEELSEQVPEEERISISAGGLAFGEEPYDLKTEGKIYSGLVESADRAEAVRKESLLSPSLLSRIELRVIPSRDRDANQNVDADIRPYDLALLDRFFTCEAKTCWVELPKMTVRENPYGLFEVLQPPLKRVFLLGKEFTSTTLLCSSALDDAGHVYLNALRQLVDKGIRADAADDGKFFYPCLQVDCDDGEIKDEIRYLHEAARWVVTSNDLIDRRQLLKSGIKIVRYKRNASTGKTSIVSSSAPTDMLTLRIKEQLLRIAPGMSDQTAAGAAQAVLNTAYRISGYVALRSAKQDASAYEVMGLALSHWIARAEARELCRKSGEKLIATASFLLDDYAAIFRNNHRLADLLRITLAEKDGRLKLHIQVTEAKFRGSSTLSGDKTVSVEQAKATADVLCNALGANNPAEPLKPVWLSRIATLVMNMSVEPSDITVHESDAVIRLSERVRKGDFDLSIDAASHMFVHDAEGIPEFDCLDDETSGRKLSQIVLYRQDIARLLKKGNDLSFEDISTVLADTSYAPRFDEMELVRDWQWADGLSLDFLGQASIPAEPKEPDARESETDASVKPDAESSDVGGAKPPEAAGESESAVETRSGENNGKTAQEETSIEKVPLTAAECGDTQVFAPSFAELVKEKGGDFSYSPEREAWAQKATQVLRTFLQGHGIPARVKHSTVTPNGCLVSFEGDERLTTKSFEKLQEILLSTKAIKVLHAEAAAGEFRILFNDGSGNRETVSLWKAWSQRTVERKNGLNLSFIVGLKESDGKLLYLDPDKFEPHTLIAGGTGSGKTALVQTLILDMAATNPSSKLKFYLIDPKKGVDFAPIRQLPHLAKEPVTELQDIPALFTELYRIMEDRYVAFGVAGVNKLSTYNAKMPREKQLPALFVIHDELAFCMQNDEYKKTVPPLMIQLATKCRAAGIYLIFIAQRPDKDVVPVQVRDNLGNRLILKVPAGTSEFALGEKGAENLLGKGHMAAKLGGRDGFEYVQVPFLSDQNEVLQEVADAIKAADGEWI